MATIPDEFLKKFEKPDGSIDWGAAAGAWLEQEKIINDQLSMRRKETMSVENLSVFKLADKLSDEIWDIVSNWDWFAKKTVGDQWVRSADSIGANIAEGYGRYFFGEYTMFLYYARGSVYETRYWLNKAHRRLLINDQLHRSLQEKLDRLPLELNKVVKIVKSEAAKWKGKPRYQ